MTIQTGSPSSGRRLFETVGTLEFVGGQRLELIGRGFPPEESRVPVAVLIGPALLCMDLEVVPDRTQHCLDAVCNNVCVRHR